jgi:hypothetical protein
VFFAPARYKVVKIACSYSEGGLVKYKAHYGLSWFSPLLGGNNPMSSGLVLKMNNDYNGVSRELEKFVK